MTEEKVDDYPDIYNFAGLTPDWARYWFAMDGWNVDEAAHLLLAVAPHATLLQSWVNHTSVGNPYDIGVAMRYEAAHRLRRDMLLRAGEASHLTFPAAPKKFIEWAMAKSLPLPELLIPLGAVFRNGEWVTSQGLTHVEPRVAPVETESASGGVRPAEAAQAMPLQRTAAQDAAILCEIKKLGHDPMALPKNPDGKPGVKAAVRAALLSHSLFIGSTVFDKAWVRLTARADIAIRG